MAARKPRIEYYWVERSDSYVREVNWRLVGANGEIMCQSTQGFRDKTDARRSLRAVAGVLLWGVEGNSELLDVRETGPGRKPA